MIITRAPCVSSSSPAISSSIDRCQSNAGRILTLMSRSIASSPTVCDARRAMFRNAEKLQRALAKMPAAAMASVNPANGRFRAPEFSGRVVAELRKACVAAGVPWTHDRVRGVEKTVARAPKGHKHDREKPLREAKIAAAMAKQPEIVAAFRARQKTKAKGLEKVWDDFVLTKRERTLKIRLQDVAGGGK